MGGGGGLGGEDGVGEEYEEGCSGIFWVRGAGG